MTGELTGELTLRWVAFNQACDRIQWKGNCAKAWLGLDKQSLGFITLHNIDAEARRCFLVPIVCGLDPATEAKNVSNINRHKTACSFFSDWYISSVPLLSELGTRIQVAENLALFRRWCFATYGGVAIAFHALDSDGSGSLSEEEFVTVIQNSSFKGGGCWGAAPEELGTAMATEVAPRRPTMWGHVAMAT